MNDLKNLKFSCTKCGNCCTDKDTLVNLTYLDILRIKKGLKLDIEELIDILGFYVFNKEITDEDKDKMVIIPIQTERGLAFVGLRKNSLGECYFYNSNKKKCLIYDLRPKFCRTFPFSFGYIDEKIKDNKNKIQIIYTEKGKLYCPGINENAPLINYEDWIKLGKQTLEELNINYNIMKQWNKMVKEGKLIPTVKKFLLTILRLNDF
jgi:Fe-S-cluster containining protein